MCQKEQREQNFAGGRSGLAHTHITTTENYSEVLERFWGAARRSSRGRMFCYGEPDNSPEPQTVQQTATITDILRFQCPSADGLFKSKSGVDELRENEEYFSNL